MDLRAIAGVQIAGTLEWAETLPKRPYLMKLDRITTNPDRMNGQPCIRGLRLTVRRVIELLAIYPEREELHQEFPELEAEDIQQALTYASAYLDDRIVLLPVSYETVA